MFIAISCQAYDLKLLNVMNGVQSGGFLRERYNSLEAMRAECYIVHGRALVKKLELAK